YHARAVRRDRQRGSTTVEFVLVLPVLLALLFGAVDGAFLVVSRCMVSYAAIVGARTASVRATTSVAAIKTATVNAVPFLALSNGDVAVAVNGTGASDPTFAAHGTGAGNEVTVTVTHTFTSYTGVFSKIGAVP